MTALTRQQIEADIAASRPIKLMGQDLSGIDLSQLKLEEANLERATLSNGNLRKVNLRKATLRGADLQGACLDGADLQGTCLSGANLKGAKLRGAKLEEAELWGAILSRAKLNGANLRGAKLEGANLRGAKLREANVDWGVLPKIDLREIDLQGAELQGVQLEGANLRGVNLRRGQLKGANLQRTDLRGADLREANLQEADLRETDLAAAALDRANLDGSRLRRASLQGTKLYGASLRGADLSRAIMRRTFLRGADLREADLRETDLLEVDLREARLEGAKYNEHTQWPTDVDPAIKGAVIVTNGAEKEEVDNNQLQEPRDDKGIGQTSRHSYSPPRSQLELSYVYNGHQNQVTLVAWSPDNKYIASSTGGEYIHVFEAHSGKRRFTFPAHNETWTFAFSPDGSKLAIGGRGTKIQRSRTEIFSTLDGNLEFVYQGQESVNAISWSPNGQYIASAGGHNISGGGRDLHAIKIWEANSGREVLNYTDYRGEGVNQIAWSPDGHYIASALDPGFMSSPDNTVHVLEAMTGKRVYTYTAHSGTVHTLAWSPWDRIRNRGWPGQACIASAGFGYLREDGGKDISIPALHVWHARKGTLLLTYQGPEFISILAWSPNGKYIAFIEENTVQIIDAETGKLLYTYTGHRSLSWKALAVSPDSRYIASGGSDGVHVWKVPI